MSEQSERADVVVFGATGYVGELVLAYLESLPPAERGRIAVAGRDVDKLAQAVARNAPSLSPEIIAADAGDPAAVDAMVAHGRVIMHLAGPYTLRGPAVVEACVRHGSHYVDLTGEALFVRDMVAQHHQAAGARGVRIVHCCGFECLPFDLTTLFAAETFKARHGVACRTVDLALELRIQDRAVLRDAAFSGGTTATMLLLLDDAHGAEMVDPCVLLPPEVDREPWRARHALQLAARYEPLTDSWTVPVFPVPTLNPQVVLRSAGLTAGPDSPYGDEFTYREAASLGDQVPQAMQRAVAGAMAAAIGKVVRVIAEGRPWQRRALAALIRRLGAQPGRGPRRELLDRFDYGLIARASGPDGEQVTVRFDGKGNPGYRSTAHMVTQAALALARDAEHLPRHHGVLTPATALGMPFMERLPRAGITLRAS